MKLIVDQAPRFAKMRAHTATHLLHAELTKIFSNTKQAWSLVDDNLLRFDFQADKMLTNQEIWEIEKNINHLIFEALPVSNIEMSIEDAQKTWAKAFFEEKYGDTVHVVSIWEDKKMISVELCGWTHVENTRDIGAFVIINQEAVASGIKRIVAYTWPKVIERLQESKILLFQIADKLWVKAENQILDKLQKELNDKKELESQFESIKTKLIIENLKSAEFKSNEIFDKIINISENPALKDLSFKDIIFQSKGIFTDINIVVYNQDGGFAIMTPKSDSSAKIIAQDLWLKWGWNDMIVQWKDSNIFNILK